MRSAAEVLALVAAGAIPVASYALVGLWITRRAGLAAPGAEGWARGYVFGTGAASLAILALRGAGVPVPLAALAAAGAIAAWALRRVPRPPLPARVEGGPCPRWARVVDAASVALAALLGLAALGPETFWDGFEYHLPMVRAWSEGPIRALPGMVDAQLRAGVDLLYLPAVAAGHPDAAAAVSAGFAATLAAVVRGETRRRAGPGAGACAGFFVLCAPLVVRGAPSSYVDLGVGAYGALALLFCDRWTRGGERRWLLAAAACLAFAANAKLHAAALVPAAALVVALGGRPPPAGAALRAAGLFAALAAPWLAKAALTTGNPLFPLLAERLGAGHATPEHLALRRFRLSTDFLAGERGPLTPLRYLASLLFGRNPHVSGLLGPLPLALLPAALHRTARPTAALTAVVAALWALQVWFMPALRFAAPLLPLVAIATAFGGARLARSGRAAAAGVAALLVLVGAHHVAGLLPRLAPRIPAVVAPARYERALFPEQVALREVVAHGRGVVAIPKGAVLWMPRPVYVLHWERNGELFFDRVAGRRTPPEAASRLLRERGVGSLVIDAPRGLRPGRTGHPTVDAWLASGRAVPRDDVPRLPAREGRVWVLVDLAASAGDALPARP